MKKYEMKCYSGEEPRIEVTEEFVTKNKLTLNRTQEEILKKIEDSSSIFGFELDVLKYYLEYTHAKEFLTGEFNQKVKEGEKQWTPITDIYETVQDFLDYMIFAWMKAQDERGLSASRSVIKLSAWMWLLGREDLANILNDNSMYNPYGSPALIEVSKQLGIEVPESLIEFSKHLC